METISSADESALADLVSLWQRRRTEGHAVKPAELCRDRPELLAELERRITALGRMNGLADAMGETLSVTLTDASTHPFSGSTSSTGRPDIPGFEILSVLGRGGMGVVYKARQTQLGRLVALKMILSGSMVGEAELARFRTEAEANARMQHGNIVQIHEVGEYDGRPFFSLEFCSGGSLADKLNSTPLPAQEAARLVQTLAQAMEAAHQAHVIHRDLKPANVLLSKDGTPKITDFGLAKRLDVAAGQTTSGAILGTPSYMAPEQASGNTRQIGPAADVYALGAILYECLTGRPPFMAATMTDTLLQVLQQEPVPPRQLQPGSPRDLETICLKCLEKDPRRRYPRAENLAQDLERFLQGKPITARPVSIVGQVTKWVKRRLLTTPGPQSNEQGPALCRPRVEHLPSRPGR
jgi:serine/threonine-protein kinase